MRLKSITRFLIGTFMTATLAAQPVTAFADTTKSTAETAFVRARIDFINEDGLSSVSEDMLIFSNKNKWTKEGNYYYYEKPIESGEKVELISGVKMPKEWDKTAMGKTFHIVVTAEASENMDGTANWSDGYARASNSTSDYKQRKSGYTTYETKTLEVQIEEFEIEKNGQKVPYRNNKYITPGEEVSKIVEISVNLSSDKKTSGGGGGGSSSGGGGGRTTAPPKDDTSVYPINDTEVRPIATPPEQPIAGVGRVPTGDNSMMIPMAAAAGCALVILLAILFKRRKKEDQD